MPLEGDHVRQSNSSADSHLSYKCYSVKTYKFFTHVRHCWYIIERKLAIKRSRKFTTLELIATVAGVWLVYGYTLAAICLSVLEGYVSLTCVNI